MLSNLLDNRLVQILAVFLLLLPGCSLLSCCEGPVLDPDEASLIAAFQINAMVESDILPELGDGLSVTGEVHEVTYFDELAYYRVMIAGSSETWGYADISCRDSDVSVFLGLSASPGYDHASWAEMGMASFGEDHPGLGGGVWARIEVDHRGRLVIVLYRDSKRIAELDAYSLRTRWDETKPDSLRIPRPGLQVFPLSDLPDEDLRFASLSPYDGSSSQPGTCSIEREAWKAICEDYMDAGGDVDGPHAISAGWLEEARGMLGDRTVRVNAPHEDPARAIPADQELSVLVGQKGYDWCVPASTQMLLLFHEVLDPHSEDYDLLGTQQDLADAICGGGDDPEASEACFSFSDRMQQLKQIVAKKSGKALEATQEDMCQDDLLAALKAGCPPICVDIDRQQHARVIGAAYDLDVYLGSDTSPISSGIFLRVLDPLGDRVGEGSSGWDYNKGQLRWMIISQDGPGTSIMISPVPGTTQTEGP